MPTMAFKVTPEVEHRLDVLVQSTGSEDRADVIRKALAVYEKLHELKGQGASVMIVDDDGNGVEFELR